MDNQIEAIVDGLAVHVRLEGGPADITLPAQRIRVDGTKIKLPHLGGYEHFERTSESGVFRWTMRTAIAE